MAMSFEEQPRDTALQPGSAAEESGVIRVLYVEDDDNCREAVAEELADHGFEVQSHADGRSLLEQAALAADVIVLDWDLPGTSGIDLLSELRKRGVDLPVVFLTGHGETRHEHLALERGAIDFVDKMRGVAVLARRLRLVAKAVQPAPEPRPDTRMVCGKLVLRPDVGRACWNDVDVGLTVCEYNIVHLLASNVGQPVTYRTIYDAMHYEGFVAGSGDNGYRTNVRSTIKRIRAKFRKCDPGFAEIGNSASIGYCWGMPGAD